MFSRVSEQVSGVSEASEGVSGAKRSEAEHGGANDRVSEALRSEQVSEQVAPFKQRHFQYLRS